ncbi:MAG: type IV pilus modification protein PilV [Halioglobus sp.]|nr:type IV pilus modification protein PilV [Halioglobus sp.]
MLSETQRGVGMLEFLVALMIFSMGMMGLLTAQLVGKKTIIEASQRSTAIALAQDVLERMRANPGQLPAYRVVAAGDDANPLPRPDVDCDVSQCTTAELAAFDLWQWESHLMGSAERDALGYTGGLLAPRGCIASVAGHVDISVSWRSVMATDAMPAEDCFDAVDTPHRHVITLSSFIAGR